MSSSDTGLSADEFIGEDGVSVRWGEVALVIAGGFATVFGVGVSAVVGGFFDLLQGVYAGIAWFASTGLKLGIGAIAELGIGAWAAAIGALEGLTGLWVPIVAVAIGLAVLGLYREVIS